ncbi:hypothetical protein ACFE04_012513 [Oxalis oulophora]
MKEISTLKVENEGLLALAWEADLVHKMPFQAMINNCFPTGSQIIQPKTVGLVPGIIHNDMGTQEMKPHTRYSALALHLLISRKKEATDMVKEPPCTMSHNLDHFKFRAMISHTKFHSTRVKEGEDQSKICSASDGLSHTTER